MNPKIVTVKIEKKISKSPILGLAVRANFTSFFVNDLTCESDTSAGKYVDRLYSTQAMTSTHNVLFRESEKENFSFR